MTPRDRDDRHDEPESEHGLYDDSPRSIFAATWFRAVLVLIVLGVVGAVAVPYILDAVNPPSPKPPVLSRSATTPPATSTTPSATPTTPPAMSTMPPPAPPPPADRATEADRSTLTPATPPLPAAQEAKPTAPKSAASRTAKTPTTEPAQTIAKAAATATTATGGSWWVQVGAFKNEATAKGLVDKLRADSYTAEQVTFRPGGASATQSTAAPSASAASSTMDQYDVFVSGVPVDEINKHLAAKGLASKPSGGGVVVTPSLPLRDAVALSKSLAVEGLKVQVKRAGAAEPKTAVAAPAPGAGVTIYRVRVGGFADRAAAQAAAKELEAKGYKPFVGRG